MEPPDDTAPNTHLARLGEAEPWKYGPYRVVITRRVTEEEQISLECYEDSRERALETYELAMTRMHQMMVAYNDRVVLVHQGKVAQLDKMIEARAEELHSLDEALDQKKRELNGNAFDAG